MQAPWAIVQIRSGSEEAAEKRFRQSGYRPYLPHYRKLISPHGRNRKPTPVMRPVFTGLLFVQDWRGWPILAIPGSMGLMPASGGRKAQLSDDDVAKMQAKERAEEFDKGLRPPTNGIMTRDDLAIGDTVEFEISGRQILGILEDLSPNGKAIIREMIQHIQFRNVDAGTLLLVAS